MGRIGNIKWDSYFKSDIRPAKGWWCPGTRINQCLRCNQEFMGGRHACWCADCAYKTNIEDNSRKKTVNKDESNKVYKDRTFCSGCGCKRYEHCSRSLTQTVRDAAAKWWGGHWKTPDYNAPISEFENPKELECYEPNDDGQSEQQQSDLYS